jgi:hypothetical protein
MSALLRTNIASHMTYLSHDRMSCSKALIRRPVEGSMVWLEIWTDETKSPSNSSLRFSGRGVAFGTCLTEGLSLKRMGAFVDMMVLIDVACGRKVYARGGLVALM